MEVPYNEKTKHAYEVMVYMMKKYLTEEVLQQIKKEDKPK